MLSFKPAFPLSSYTRIKRLFSSSSLSVVRVVSSGMMAHNQQQILLALVSKYNSCCPLVPDPVVSLPPEASASTLASLHSQDSSHRNPLKPKSVGGALVLITSNASISQEASRHLQHELTRCETCSVTLLSLFPAASSSLFFF